MSKLIIPNNEQFSMDIQLDIDPLKSRIGFITGAGASVGSGLPTYYGKGGYYTNLKENPEDVLNIRNMRDHPEKIWDAIGSLVKQGLMAKPSITHNKIAEIQSIAKESLLLTQNVDCLHQKAGSVNIVDIHGSGDKCYCSSCAKDFEIISANTIDLLPAYKKGSAPICPKCNQPKMVPDIVAFGDSINDDKYWKVLDFYSKPVDICFIIGTQVSFTYIETALYDTQRNNNNAIIIDINPDVNHYNPYADYIFHEKCDDFFERIKLI